MIERFTFSTREEWLALRSHDLTASSVGAVLGLDPYVTALRVYGEKTGALLPDGENQLMRRGRWMEAAVIAALREERPDLDIRHDLNLYLRDPAVRLGATPDAVAATDAAPEKLINVQCKTISRPVFEKHWADDAIPPAYLFQCLTEGYLLNADHSLLAALVIDTFSATLELREIPRHAAAEARIRVIAADFWRNVAAGQMPAPDYGRDAETIADLYPVAAKAEPIDLSADNLLPAILSERAQRKTRMEKDAKRVIEIDTEIKAKLGDHAAAIVPGWKISWKDEHRKAYSVAETTRRVLRISSKDEAA